MINLNRILSILIAIDIYDWTKRKIKRINELETKKLYYDLLEIGYDVLLEDNKKKDEEIEKLKETIMEQKDLLNKVYAITDGKPFKINEESSEEND